MANHTIPLLGVVLLAVGALAWGAPQSQEQQSTARLREELVDLRIEREGLQAKVAVLQDELAALQAELERMRSAMSGESPFAPHPGLCARCHDAAAGRFEEVHGEEALAVECSDCHATASGHDASMFGAVSPHRPAGARPPAPPATGASAATSAVSDGWVADQVLKLIDLQADLELAGEQSERLATLAERGHVDPIEARRAALQCDSLGRKVAVLRRLLEHETRATQQELEAVEIRLSSSPPGAGAPLEELRSRRTRLVGRLEILGAVR